MPQEEKHKNMSEKIKNIKATRYDQKIDSIMDKELKIVEAPLSLKEYDEHQHLIHESNWGPGGMLSEKFTYEFDGDLLVKRCTYSEENEIAETEIYKYNEDGVLTQTILEYFDGSKDITTHTYDSEGNKIKSLSIDEDGDETQQEFWEYHQGHLTYYKLINDFGEVEEEQKMVYNDKGLIISKDYFNAMEETNYRTTYEYDEAGKLIVEYTYNEKGKLKEEKSYKYDESGKVILEQKENAQETTVKKMEYDKAGNEIYQIEREEDDDMTIYEVWREFDSANHQTQSRVLIYGNVEQSDVEYVVKYTYEFYS